MLEFERGEIDKMDKAADAETIGAQREDIDYEDDLERSELPLDDLASVEEMAGFRKGIEASVASKAQELGVPEQEVLDAAQLDLASLEGAELSRGDLEFIKDNLEKSIAHTWRSKITGNKYLPEEFSWKVESKDPESYLDRMVRFANKHHRVASLFQLAVYASAWGPAVIKSLATDNKALNVGDREITLAEIAKNPELMQKIDKERNLVTPLDISHCYAHGSFADAGDPADPDDVSRISVVALDDFKFKDAPIGEAHAKEKEITARYQDEQGKISEQDWQQAEKELDAWSQSRGYDNFTAAYDAENAADSATSRFAKLKFDETAVAKSEYFDQFSTAFLKAMEKHYTLEEVKKIAEENPEQIPVIIAETLREETDYDWSFAIKKMIAEAAAGAPGPAGKYIGDKWDESLAEREAKGVPYSALERGKVVCTESSETFIAAKVALERAGVRNLDKLACFATVSLDEAHMWSGMATLSSDGEKIIYSAGDTTLFEKQFFELGKELEDENLDAVDDWHFYEAVNEDAGKTAAVIDADAAGLHYIGDADVGMGMDRIAKAEQAHAMTLEAIKRYNVLAFQESLKRDLMMYDVGGGRKGGRIELDHPDTEVQTQAEQDGKEEEERTLLARIRAKIRGGD